MPDRKHHFKGNILEITFFVQALFTYFDIITGLTGYYRNPVNPVILLKSLVFGQALIICRI